MLFGSSRKAYGTSNIMPGDQPGIPQLPTGIMDPGAQQPSGRGKVNWVGVLADALAGAAGQQGPYLASIQARQAQAAKLAAEQRQRSQGFDDWRQKREWEIAHPAPVNNDTLADFAWYKGLSDADRALYHQMKPQYRQGPDGQFYPIQVAPAAPTGPLPTFTADDWNKAGGGAGNGAGSFR